MPIHDATTNMCNVCHYYIQWPEHLVKILNQIADR